MNYRIIADELKDLQIQTVGYKILHSSLVAHDYAYGKEGEDIVGNVYKTTEEPVMCKTGFHCCSNPLAAFRYYSPNTNDRFFKVRLYGTVLRGYDKDVGSIIEFVEEYSFDRFLYQIEQYYANTISMFDFMNNNHRLRHRNFADEVKGIISSAAIDNSRAVVESIAISDSKAITKSNGVVDSTNIYASDAIQKSTDIHNSVSIASSTDVKNSTGVAFSSGIFNSGAVSHSRDVRDSINVSDSGAIIKSRNIMGSTGVESSENIFGSIAIVGCNNLRNSLFCHGKDNSEYCLFNTRVSPARIREVRNYFLDSCWMPTILGQGYFQRLSWKEIPRQLEHYIKNLNEFDPFIWGRIVGDV